MSCGDAVSRYASKSRAGTLLDVCELAIARRTGVVYHKAITQYYGLGSASSVVLVDGWSPAQDISGVY